MFHILNDDSTPQLKVSFSSHILYSFLAKHKTGSENKATK